MNDDIVIDWPAATLIAHRDLCLDCVEIYDLHLTFDPLSIHYYHHHL